MLVLLLKKVLLYMVKDMNRMRIAGLMLSFGLEVFCTQILFIYIPLMMLFSGEGELITSVIRALAYIGPVFFGFYIGSIIDETNKRRSGFLVALGMATLTAIFGFMNLFEHLWVTVIYLFMASISTYFLNNLRVTALPVLIKSSSLSKANSLLLIVENVALLATPAISSLMIKFTTPSFGIGILSACFLFSSLIYLLSLKDYPMFPRVSRNLNYLESFRLLYANKKLVYFVLAMMGNNAFIGIFSLYIMIHGYDSGIFNFEETPFILIASGIGCHLFRICGHKNH